MRDSVLSAAEVEWLPTNTLGELLARAARFDRGVRFLDRRERATFLRYDELLRRARRTAVALRERGIGSGDRAALVLSTCPLFYDGFFGAILAGAIPVPLYPPVRLGRLDEYHARTAAMLKSVEARMVVTDRSIRRILGTTIERAAPPLGCVTATELVPEASEVPAATPARCDDVAFIQMSSGTTRAPKPIRLTHRQVLSNVARIVGGLLDRYPESDRLTHAGVSWLPLYHDMGLVGCVLVALSHPGDLTLIPPEAFVARPAIWLRTLARYEGTISPAPNFAYALCADRIRDSEIRGLDLSSWRVALNGAEPVTPTALDRFVERFVPYGLRREALTPVYGLAEASLAVSFSELREPFRWTTFDREDLGRRGLARPASDGVPLVSLGRALPGFDIRIVDDDGAPLGADRCGRVLVRGPSIMQGYHGMPDRTAESMHDGWLDTGDLGFFHEGELYLHGRRKDTIIIRGCNHAPDELEQSLGDLEGVRPGCSAAVGVTSADGAGEQLVVIVEHARGAAPNEAAAIAERVQRRLLHRLGIRPDRVEVVAPGTLPRTSSGKIRRGEAKRRLSEAALEPPAEATALRLMGAMARSQLSFARLRRRT